MSAGTMLKWRVLPLIATAFLFQVYLVIFESRRVLEGSIQEVTKVWIAERPRITLEPDFFAKRTVVSSLSSPLGKLLTVGSKDGSVRVFRLPRRRQQQQEKDGDNTEQQWQLVSFRNSPHIETKVKQQEQQQPQIKERLIGVSTDGRIIASKYLNYQDNSGSIRIFRRRSTDDDLLLSPSSSSSPNAVASVETYLDSEGALLASSSSSSSDWEEEVFPPSHMLTGSGEQKEECFGQLTELSGNGRVLVVSAKDPNAKEFAELKCRHRHDDSVGWDVVFRVFVASSSSQQKETIGNISSSSSKQQQWMMTGDKLGENMLKKDEHVSVEKGWDLGYYHFSTALNHEGSVFAIAASVEWDRSVFKNDNYLATETYRIDSVRVYKYGESTGWKLLGQPNILNTTLTGDDGQRSRQFWGGSIDLSDDGRTLSIPLHSACVIYELNDVDSLWIQKGSPIRKSFMDGKCRFSSTSSLSSSSAAGAANSISSGTPNVAFQSEKFASVFEWKGGDWSHVGNSMKSRGGRGHFSYIALIKSGSVLDTQASLFLSSENNDDDEGGQVKGYITEYKLFRVLTTFFPSNPAESISNTVLVWKKFDPITASIDSMGATGLSLKASPGGDTISFQTSRGMSCYQRTEKSSSIWLPWGAALNKTSLRSEEESRDDSMSCAASETLLPTTGECSGYYIAYSGNQKVAVVKSSEPNSMSGTRRILNSTARPGFRVCTFVKSSERNQNNVLGEWRKKGSDFDANFFGPKNDGFPPFGRFMRFPGKGKYRLNYEGDVLAVSMMGTILTYKYISGSGWTQLGQSIGIKEESLRRFDLSNDGKVLVATVMGPENIQDARSTKNMALVFTARVYEYHSDSGWKQKGQSISDDRHFLMYLSINGNVQVVAKVAERSISVFDYEEQHSSWVQRGQNVAIDCFGADFIMSKDGKLMGARSYHYISLYHWNAEWKSWESVGSSIYPFLYVDNFLDFAFTESANVSDTSLFVAERNKKMQIYVSEWKLMPSNTEYSEIEDGRNEQIAV